MSFNLITYLIILHNSFQFDLQFAFLLSGEVKKKKFPRRVFLEEEKVFLFLANKSFVVLFSFFDLFLLKRAFTLYDANDS